MGEQGGSLTQSESIISAFQLHGNQMSLRQMAAYPWFFEFRSRKVEINRDHIEYQIRYVKGKDQKASDHLYVLERKPKTGELL